VRRVVIDPGVLVSALIAPTGAPAKLLAQAQAGELEMIVSPSLLDELGEVLGREKSRRYADLDAVDDYLDLLRRHALVVPDPEGPPPLRSADLDDDYLIALAHHQNAALVSGDKHLLDIAGGAPILAPADLLAPAQRSQPN
jgi:putative PIN family toxin of toxin-antitoxin system